MKYLYAALIVLVLGGAGVLFARAPAELMLRCEAELRQTVNNTQTQVTMDASATIFMMKNGEGFVNLYGVLIGDDEQKWIVNRKVAFFWTYHRENRLYDVTIRQVEIKNVLDRAPENLMSMIYTPRFSMEVQRVGNNGLLMRGISSPWFICQE